MLITDKKAQRLEVKGKGPLGSRVRYASCGGEIYLYPGDELPSYEAGTSHWLNDVIEFADHLLLNVSPSMSSLKRWFLVIAKGDVRHWGVLREGEVHKQLREIKDESKPGPSATVGQSLAQGALEFVADLAGLGNWAKGVDYDPTESERSAMFIAYDSDGAEHVIFVTFATKRGYRDLHELLGKSVPDVAIGSD